MKELRKEREPQSGGLAKGLGKRREDRKGGKRGDRGDRQGRKKDSFRRKLPKDAAKSKEILDQEMEAYWVRGGEKTVVKERMD